MFGILLSALNVVLGFVLRSIIVKFVTYFALWFITTEFISVLQGAGILPSAASVTSALGGFGTATWYFLDLCAVSYGVPAILAAFAARFIIRRLPVIG